MAWCGNAIRYFVLIYPRTVIRVSNCFHVPDGAVGVYLRVFAPRLIMCAYAGRLNKALPAVVP